MMGVLHVNRDNKIFLDNYAEHKKIHLSGRWCFCHMENININGREAMIKDYYDPEDPDSQKSGDK